MMYLTPAKQQQERITDIERAAWFAHLAFGYADPQVQPITVARKTAGTTFEVMP